MDPLLDHERGQTGARKGPSPLWPTLRMGPREWRVLASTSSSCALSVFCSLLSAFCLAPCGPLLWGRRFGLLGLGLRVRTARCSCAPPGPPASVLLCSGRFGSLLGLSAALVPSAAPKQNNARGASNSIQAAPFSITLAPIAPFPPSATQLQLQPNSSRANATKRNRTPNNNCCPPTFLFPRLWARE